MYNSLQHFNEFGTRKIEETIKNFINEKYGRCLLSRAFHQPKYQDDSILLFPTVN
jgi:hypothetical protein